METGNKRLINLYILDILQKYTDRNTQLRQCDIIEKLQSEYGIICDRRTVGRVLDDLNDYFDPFDRKIVHISGKGYWLQRTFEEWELRMLVDSVLFSKTISQQQAKALIKKLQRFASKNFEKKVTHVCNLPSLSHTDNEAVAQVVDVINAAIEQEKKIQFIFNEMGLDKKLHPKKNEPYVVNPYQMVANNGRFYLIGNMDGHDNLIHLRIDKMTKIEILAASRKKEEEIPELAHGKKLDLPKHMAEHIYMFSGETVPVWIKTQPNRMGDLVDWFGKDFTIEEEKEDYIVIRVKCNESAIRYWALQYGPNVEVLRPKELRDQLRKDVENMWQKYCK
ncbi:hypothetical protein D081_1262 [Anaerovibrio sp. JC8]|uniref:helix-turn-helix transcriptional regulator n=1 Tax=Anaerovibrio sp. JC8 TaxID=1240085 RepID=UPI000A0C5B0C|nr:WYL domain-containing protein [Anaerovibrio sp. JC8]ORU00168.1 hypothetical protein D081_1262 [Anaerovibrio sp. JC8]